MSRRKGLHTTPRDLRMGADLGDALVMSMPMFHERHWHPEDTTGESCLRRLIQLTGAGLFAHVAGDLVLSRRESVYRLTEQGSAWLAFHAGMPARRILQSQPKLSSIAHRLNVARVLLAINDGAAAEGLPKPVWLLEYDRYPDAPCNIPIPRQYVLAEDFTPLSCGEHQPVEQYGPPRYDSNITLVKARPDSACILTIPEKKAAYAFYVEMDNGTETISSQLLPTKLPGLHALLSMASYRHHWSQHGDVPLHPRVLFVFTSAQRLENVRQRLVKDPSVLWHRPSTYKPTEDDEKRALAFLEQHVRFTFLDDLLASPRRLSNPIWRSLTGQPKAIYRRPDQA